MRARRPAIVLLLATSAAACGPNTAPAPDVSVNDVSVNDVSATDAPSSPDVATVEDATTTPDATAPSGDPTWWRDIKPIADQMCNNCHVAGGIGPMALVDYATVRPMARLIANQVRDRIMPPWMPREGCRDVRDSRALTDAEIAKFVAWEAAGAPEGNMADYRAPAARPNTSRPLPARDGDIVVQPSGMYLPNQSLTDDYHCFIMDPALTTTRDVIGVRVTPGNARIVHHVILFEVRERSLPDLQRLDDAEPGPGYTCYGGAGVNPNVRAGTDGDLVDMSVQMVTGWAPGGVAGYFPTGTGVRLKPGSRLVMQVHYNLQAATRGMNDRSRVDLFLADAAASTQQAFWLPQANQSFTVPAGVPPTDPRATVVSNFRNTQLPVRIFGVAPHMHTRGHSIRVEAINASSASTCLVDIPRWDFHWQQGFFFQTPYRTAAGAMGDTFRTTCVYDNRPENQPYVDGVQVAPRDLRWGEGTNDEMCLNFFYVSI
ncbi:MAG: hypothetical protein JNK05_28325 [Myxococcales bacterium]|nr:hypothetical protein [Myxococcales bacterium]